MIAIRGYKDNDEFLINKQFNTIFNQNRTIEEWNWKYKYNILKKTFISVAYVDNDLAAHYAGYPFYLDYYNNGNITTKIGIQIGDKFTVPKFRNIGFGKTSLLTKVFQYFTDIVHDNNIDFTIGFGTYHSRKFGKLFLGYKDIGKIGYYTLINFPKTSPFSFLKYYSYDIIQIESFDSAFTDLYNNFLLSTNLPMVRKDADYLNWRYCNRPDVTYDIFAIFKRNNLVNWFVCKPINNCYTIGDYLDLNNQKSLDIFLTYLQQYNRFKPSNIVLWYGYDIQNLDNSLFKKINEPNDLSVLIPHCNSNQLLSSLKNTNFRMGDSDLF